MTLHATWIELNSNSIEEKWDANWYKKVWKFTHDYALEKKFKKHTNLKRHLSIPFYLGIGQVDSNYHPKGWLMETKLLYLYQL
jgi:hypothetical protein